MNGWGGGAEKARENYTERGLDVIANAIAIIH